MGTVLAVSKEGRNNDAALKEGVTDEGLRALGQAGCGPRLTSLALYSAFVFFLAFVLIVVVVVVYFLAWHGDGACGLQGGKTQRRRAGKGSDG